MISLSKSFESLFLERFEDVSDIIIGWLVEPTEDFDTYMELCQSMLDLERFWRQNMHQTVQYFDDFLKDIREFTGDAKKGFEEFEADSKEWDVFTTPLGNTLKQLEFRLRTYKCLMRAIGLETFTKNSYFDDAFLSRQLNVIVNISNEFLTKKRFCALEALTKSVVELTCMLVSGSTSGWQQKQIPASVLEFTRKLIDAVPESSCIIAITLVLVLIQEAPCGLPEEFATTFINELSHWKNIEHPDTVAELLGVYQSALGCSVSQVIQQSAYYCVLGELQLTLNELLRYHGATKRIEIHAIKKYINIAVAKVEDVHDFASEQKALHSALFLVTALTEFASTKVNVLSVHEIEPSFFVLVEKELRPAMVELNYPALEFALVTALRSHCECHGHFINNFLGNTRLMNKDALQSLKKYYPRLMKFVSFLLTKKNGAFSVRDLAISWAKDIIRCVNKTELGRPEGKRGLTYVNEFEELTEATVEAAWQADRGQLLAIHRCLEYAIGAAPESVAKHVIRGVFWLSSHADHEISDSYNKLLLNIPASAMNNFSEKDFDENSRNTVLYRAWIARRALMCRPQQFKNEQFSGVMDLLLNSKDEGLFEMLERGVWWSGRETKGNLAATNQHLNFWALWDAAAFCVENRLKTPLGSNIQTLNAIEKGIKGFERSLGMPTAKLPKKSDEHVKLLLTRPRLLIAYLGNLERLFFNAYEGCVSLPPASKSVRTFFINNKPICVKWLRGLRLSIMRVSLHCGLPADAWHHGQQLLSILVPAGRKIEIDRSNLERTLMMCAEAGIALKDESRLSGLYFWASRLDVEMNFIWLKGCALQSAGKFEPAIAIYQQYLNAEAERRISNPDDDHVNTAEIFVRQQISESFLSISNWEKAQNWLESNSDYPQLGNLDYVKCMRSYDLDGIQGYDKQEVKGHCSDYLAKVPETTWRWPLMKQIADVQLLLAKVDRENKSIDMLEDVGRTMILAEGLQWPCQIKQDAIGILHGSSLARDAKGAQKNYQNFKIRAKLAECNEIPIICRLRLQSSASCLEEGRFERSRGNFNRASNLFYRAGLLVDKEVRGNRRSVDLDIIYKIERQECKRLASLENYSEAIMRLGHKTSERLQRQAQANGPHFSVTEDKEISKSLLNLVNWMEKDWERVGPELEAMARGGDRNQLCNSLAFLVTAEQKITDRTLVKPSLLQEAQQEAVLGCFVNLASIKQPSYAKAHRALGSFCYKWGKRVIDGATKSGLVTLTPTESSIIEQSLRKVIWSSEEEFQSQFSQMRDLIGRTQLIEYPEDNADNISILQQEEQVTVKLYNQFPWLYQYGSITATMLSIWRMVSDRLFELYSRAATAYFDALRVAEKDIDASLRLLRLLAKHSGGLKTVLENGLRNSSVSSWLEIVPQLFSRLHHPEPYVRNAITELLERIAQQKPDEVVFAVVVALTKADHRIEAGLRNFDANEQSQTPSSSTMSEQQAALQRIRNNLSPIVVKDVEVVVHELRRITLLWDELWLGSLTQHYSDIQRRLARLAEEAKRLNSNASLTMDQKSKMMNELQQAQMKPVLTAFQHLAQITAAKPETPMEEKFQRRYGKLIQEALNRLKSNPAPMQPALSWAPFKQLHQELLARAGKRGQLVMKEISPKLAKLKDTYLPVPGRSGLTVSKFHGVLSILPTKTRPKKLHLRGGDGRTYTYLFKGLEDLHLDERIMQFLSVCNSLLPTGLSARNYSVTPLGSRSGLIGWVHGSNPFFVFYKKWQIRQQDKLNLSENVKVDRPVDVFNNKVFPALSAAGVNPEKSSRREWPSSILREAHRELVKETPNDLIEKELWCNSTCSADFLNTQTIFSKSLAVMSMLGYVIGLGDRHLDNILFDQETGEIVHIDYNICFEKGATLRVPERVPFRLTQNMEGALGVSGLQGPFKEACEETMRTLRDGRDTLMTLLEAFVYDPLVDWTGAVDAGYAGAVYGGAAATNQPDKGEMDREIQRSLLATRLLEVRQPMIGIQEETNRHLAALIEKLEEYEIVNVKLSKEQEMHKQIQTASRFLDQIADGNLKTLGDRFKRFKIMQNKNHKLKELLHEKCVRLAHFQQASEQIGLNSAREIELLVDELLTPISNIPFAVNSAEVYMREIGQKQLSVQASELFNQLNTTLVRRHQITHRGVKMLAAYISVRALYPKSCIATHRINFWCDSFRKLQNEMSMEAGGSIKKAHEKLLEAEDASMNGARKRLIKAKAHCLSLQIDEPREGLQAKLAEIHRRQAQQESVFADMIIAKKAVEMATKDLLADLPRVELPTLKCLVKVFTQNYLKSLTMEEHVATAGPKLASINSKSGDWFFEELKSLYFEQREIVTICARVFPTAVAPLNLQDIQLTSDVYTCLGKLYSEWRGYIVPEAVSLLQVEESTQLIDGIINLAYSQPLSKMISNLSCVLKNRQVDATTEQYLETAAFLETTFDELCDGVASDGSALPGLMLVKMCNDIFKDITVATEKLVLSFYDLVIPERWTQPISPAKKLIRNETYDSRYLRKLLFLRQLEALSSFFSLVRGNALSFSSQSETNPKLLSEEELAKPIKVFIANFIQEVLLGMPSYAMGRVSCALIEVCGSDELSSGTIDAKDLTAAVERSLSNEEHDENEVITVTAVVMNYIRNWKMFDITRRLSERSQLIKSCLKRAILQKTSFQWLHEDVLCDQLDQANMRSRVIKDFQEILEELRNLDKAIVEILKNTEINEADLLKRLKWSSGTNPRVKPIEQAVLLAKEDRKTLLAENAEIAKRVERFIEGVYTFESLRLPGFESNKFDCDNLKLIETSIKIISDYQTCSKQVLPEEVTLTDLTPPLVDDKTPFVPEKWRQNCRQELKIKSSNLNHSKSHSNNRIKQVKVSIKEFSGFLATLHNQRKKALREVIKLLQEIPASNPASAKAKGWLEAYADYAESVKDLANELSSQSESIILAERLIAETNSLLDETTKINTTLFALAEQEHSSSDKELPPQAPSQDPGLNFGQNLKAPQSKAEPAKNERNQTAILILKRIQQKLDGHDPDENLQKSLSDQVDHVISEARAIHNLALMYEGWTSWV